jgi:ureidoglycolate lyase
MKSLTVEPLTTEGFFEFGDVIEMDQRTSRPMNRGMAERFHGLATVETYGDKAKAVISLVHSRCYDLPHSIELVERHPLGSQSFIPLDETPFIVIVAPMGDTVDPTRLRAFKTNGKQGINYRAGAWHGPLFTPFDAMNFVCVDRDGEGNNCEEWMFAEAERRTIETY